MKEDKHDPWCFIAILFLVFITGKIVSADSLDTDKNVLLDLKFFLEERNQVNKGQYSLWDQQGSNPCNWTGIKCTADGSRVTGINLADNNISGELYHNFSALTALSYLDLSSNTFIGVIPYDLSNCQNLVYLNLSHNTLIGVLNLSGLNNLETLDLAKNRISGGIGISFPQICNKLVVANLSENNFTGSLGDYFDGCLNLQYLDLSSNLFDGGIWKGFTRLKSFCVSENHLNGEVLGSYIAANCSLHSLDISENNFSGSFPGQISNCRNLLSLFAAGNNFTGPIPLEIGSILSLKALSLGSNSFQREIPESLLNLSSLSLLDVSMNNFRGDIQDIFGKLTQLKNLVLHSNSYTSGIYSSGILKLPNVVRLDLSYNNFSGQLPTEFSQMQNLKILVLAYNQFNGSIPPEYGHMKDLELLDISFNRLTGQIPPSLGNLTSLLWLMLANNMLTGEIPPDLGNCSSLMWLNLAHNQLSGNLPPELMKIGQNPDPTFQLNRQNTGTAGSGECLTMRRWIPADYPPFSFIYTLLTRKTCRNLWSKLLQGYGIFPACTPGSSVREYQISGYLQLAGNQLSGPVPVEIGNMQKLSMVHLGYNKFSGNLPSHIAQLQLTVLNLTQNGFSGEIPADIGNMKCLQNLDLSCNNFSGTFPESLNTLTELNKFNISYNPLISGTIPSTGQLATFDNYSYLGDPLLHLPDFIKGSTGKQSSNTTVEGKADHFKVAPFLVTMVTVFFISVALSLALSKSAKNLQDSSCPLEEGKYRHGFASGLGSSSPWVSDSVEVIRLDKRTFKHSDILNATGHFSDTRIIGKGGFGTVYRGVLPDGRKVAVKKLQREGIDGEKEFQAEMEVLSGNSFGWPHPNLVELYGWCLDDSEKILVYEYMEGGSLEDMLSDRVRLTWRQRIDIAIDVARALVFLHHECYPAIVHRDVKASNVLLDKDGKAKVTDFGLARFVEAGDSHVTTMVAGTVGYVAPEYGQTWQATTKGDVYSFGVLAMELATGRRAVDGGEECLVEWARRVMGFTLQESGSAVIPLVLFGSGLAGGAVEMCDLLRIGVRCTSEAPQARPNMKEVLAMLTKLSSGLRGDLIISLSPPSK